MLRIHGNVHYDFLYRSYVDTPFSQRDYQQHTIRTSLNIVVKDRYPLNVNLSRQFSNSPYFRDFLNVHMQFDRSAYLQRAKQQLLERLSQTHLQKPDLSLAEATLKQAIDRYNALKQWLGSGDVLQRLIEEREKRYYRQLAESSKQPVDPLAGVDWSGLKSTVRFKGHGFSMKEKPSIPLTDSSYSDFIAQKKKELDSLGQRMGLLQAKTDSLKNALQNDFVQVKQTVYKATQLSELKEIQQQQGLPTASPRSLENFLSYVKSIGLGRSMINYSELTAWNVALTGLNVEYHSGVYAALAGGKIDYGFRDFLGKASRQNGQQLFIGRLGWADKDRKALIFSAFSGRKYNFGSTFIDSLSRLLPVAGYSIEGILKKNEFTAISAEVAKTTRPVSGGFHQNRELKSLVDFSDMANLGISIKGQTMLSRWGTRISGFYRKTGEYFQSFSLFSYNTDQTAWLLKMEQSFLKQKLGVVAALRRNDFVNPFTEKTFKTSTVFKSIQLQARLPRWPALSVGYYPGSQLYLINKERIRESVYYILNGSLVHSYKAGQVRMLSSLVYNHYSNKATDSGFIAYSGVSYTAAHNVVFQKAQLLGAYTFTDQEQMRYYSLEAGGEYALGRSVRLGGAGKYNRIIEGRSYWGSRAHLAMEIKRLGGLQIHYEKSYLPTTQQTLFAVEVGRVSWFKYF